MILRTMRTAILASYCLFVGMNHTEALAQALRIEVAGGDDTPELNGDSNWVWTVFYETDSDGGAATIQFGVQATGTSLISGSVNSTGLLNGGVEVGVPGQPVFGWESIDVPDGNGTLPSGFQIDVEQGLLGEAYFSFLTGDLPANSELQLAQFVTTGPSTSGLTSGLSLVGAFNSNGVPAVTLPGTHGVIGQSNGSTFEAASNSITALLGDADLDGDIDQNDRNVVVANFGTTESDLGWLIGDFDGDGAVNDADAAVFNLDVGDADLDGDVDRDDYNIAAANFGVTDSDVGLVGGDFDGDRDVDGADLAVFNDLVDAVNYTANDSDNGNDAREVDAADYTIWRDSFASQTDLDGDGDGDNVVTILDRNLWAESYGINLFDPAPSVMAPVATPEPTAIALLLVAAPTALCRRSR